MKCDIPSCKLDSSAKCGWKKHAVNDAGDRVYSGETCGLALCPSHANAAGRSRLCLWHLEKATREGLI